MSKAEEKADKVYPVNRGSGIDRVISMVNRKNGYIQGYKQAEKDLALTWEDIKVIYEIFDALDNEHHSTFNMGIQQYFQEVLRRFRETKNK